MLFGQQREDGCQKIKCLIRFGLYLQGDCLWVECQGGGAHGRQQSMAVTHSCSTEGHDSPGPGWHFSRLPAAVMGSQWPFQELGYRMHVSAIILISVYADRVLREQLETSLPFLCFCRSINIESVSIPRCSSQISSPLRNSSSSKNEIEPYYPGNLFFGSGLWIRVTWVPLGLCIFFVTLVKTVIQGIISISVLGPWAPGEQGPDLVPPSSPRPGPL